MNGDILQVKNYPDLHQRIGYRYGGNNSTTFALPNVKGKFIRAWNNTSSGNDVGRVLGSTQGDAIREIWGSISLDASYPSNYTGAFYDSGNKVNSNEQAGGGSDNLIYFNASRVVPVANENRPVNISFPFLVKALP